VKYVPFLKAKQNEIRAISLISKDRLKEIIPFFDIPRSDANNPVEIKAKIQSAKKTIERAHKTASFWFYIDVYDIPGDVIIDGSPIYDFVLNEFSGFSTIPVIGLDRDPEHLKSVKKNLGDKIYLAIRLVDDDLISFNLTKRKLEAIFNQFQDDVVFDLILDCRLINEHNHAIIAKQCSQFLDRVDELPRVADVIVTSSSIPPLITELVQSKTSCIFTRYEWELWNNLVFTSAKNVVYGDYTVVSPEYADTNIPVELMRNVQCPKVIYTDLDKAFVTRGGALKTNGDAQFYQLAEDVLNCGHYRKSNYSLGDKYIDDVANKKLTKRLKGGTYITICGSPSKWIETTVNCHVSFIIDNA
tara:strand:- start:1126 stop:2199 length:1074 start_codon:yes stop_codon:yes gene_type:complete